MYISAFHINGFGIFANVGGDGLLPGISIFYGRNEAGKSTCLEFFRAMLTGYPDKGKSGVRSYEPLNGGRPGGSLTLQWREGEMRLARAPSAYGGLRLNSADGSVLHLDELSRLLGGIDRESYRRVFGFSLDELEKWDKKDNESIRNALYGATFGPGLVPPGEVMENLGKEMGKIFKAKGARPQLSSELAELEKLRQQIARLQNDNAEYNNIAGELALRKERLVEIAREKEDLELSRMRLERRQGIRQQWEQWNIVKIKLDRMPEPNRGFPEDAQTRLARLETEKNLCSRDVAEAREKLRQMQGNADSIIIEASLLGELPFLRQLNERKNSYRQAAAQIPGLIEACASFESALQDRLALLGPGWDCDRIRKTDRSIFTRKDIESQAAEMGEARMAHQAAMTTLSSANREVELAVNALKAAEEKLAEHPELPAPLSGEERDSLRASMARLEDSRRLEPRRKQALETANNTFQRAIEQLGLFDGSQTRESGVKILESLAARQDMAVGLASDIQQKLRDASEAAEKAEAAKAEVEEARGVYDELRASQREAGGATRETLDARASALRSLRSVAAAMSAEAERKEELEKRIEQEKIPASTKNWSLITISIIFLLAAAGILAAHWFLGMRELDLGEGIIIPINLWAGYAALFCGVVLMGGGISANTPERERQKREMRRLLASSETSSMHLAELAEQSRDLCEQAGVDAPDPVEMDATEMRIESDKRQLLQDEQSARELMSLKGRLDNAIAKMDSLVEIARQKEIEAREARKNWHAMMQEIGVENVPAPESAATIFARAEAALLAFENVGNAQRELDAFWEDLHLMEQSITSLPAIAACLENAPEALGIEEAVKHTLAICHDADEAREKRLRCEADMLAARNELERAEKRQGQAYAHLEELAARLAKAKHMWQKCLDSMGIAEQLDPETARAAYDCMGQCLLDEENLQRARRELAQARAEVEALENPLSQSLARLQVEAKIDANGKPDWLATLDKLLADADEQGRQSDRLKDLRQAIAAQKEALAAKEAALKQSAQAVADLLALGGCSTADEFLSQASLRDNRRSLSARMDDLEAVLAQAARGEDLPTFLASFGNENFEEQEKKLMDTRAAIARLAEEERETAAATGNLEARAEMLANNIELANLRQQENILLESIRRDAGRWSALSLARTLLQKARSIFEKERQPRIIQMASDIFNNITDGRWRGLSLNLEDSSLMVLPVQGEPVPPWNLSRGAQEQAYLAFRLAYIKEHAETREALPVIMDEILVNFDPERAKRTAGELARLASEGDQQILYFTCQPHMVDLLQKVSGTARLFHVENGQIRAA